jgi:hypothetical protein
VPNSRARLDELASIAVKALPGMIDEAAGLFVHKTVRTDTGVRNEGMNPLYSAMSLIGLVRDDSSEARGALLRLDNVFDELHRRALETTRAALLGTAMWALALAGDRRTRSLLERLERRFDVRAWSSMDVGLVLAGLAATFEAFSGFRDRVRPLADGAGAELGSRFSDTAQLFRGSRSLRPSSALHRNVTSFASQVYPIHGLAEYARVTSGPSSDAMCRAADSLVERQGHLGQWWWLYSARTGAILEGYPVYSVHQDGMAFMALAPLQNLGLGSYADAVWRGLDWVVGANELERSLVDRDRGIIARCIQRTGSDADGYAGISRKNHFEVVLASFGFGKTPGTHARPDELEVLSECRPYHLGWLLYARSLVRTWDAAAGPVAGSRPARAAHGTEST